MAKYKQGLYTPINVEKYLGDPTKVRYMSSWELRMFQFLDNNPNILKWGSEEIKIPYIKPTDKKVHMYWPDFFIIYKDKQGRIKQELIEVKPLKQTKPPRKNASMYEKLTYAVNCSKWQAAAEWCKQNNVEFRLLTEKQIYN